MAQGLFWVCCFLLLNVACSRHVPRFSELDEEDQHLFRAAYDTPSYHDEYSYEEDLQPGKVDLLKDGLWALKAKIKELKAFDKSLAANLLATKLQVKELLENHLGPLKKHKHEEKPGYNSYSYQSPSYQQPSYAAYPAAPAPQAYAHDPYYGH